MRRRHAISPEFSGHYQDLGISSSKGHASAYLHSSHGVAQAAKHGAAEHVRRGCGVEHSAWGDWQEHGPSGEALLCNIAYKQNKICMKN